jgi:hypothetical protein
MSMQGYRVKLGQDRHAIDIRIDAVADRDIDQAIFSANGNSWFSAVAHQGVKTGSTSTTEDNPQNIVHGLHKFSPPGLIDTIMF